MGRTSRPSVKYGGGGIIMWGVLLQEELAWGNRKLCGSIEQHVKTSARKLKLGHKRFLQVISDPKDIARLDTKQLKNSKTKSSTFVLVPKKISEQDAFVRKAVKKLSSCAPVLSGGIFSLSTLAFNKLKRPR